MNRLTIERLFEVYSTNLALHLPEYAGYFACPFCLRLFTRKAIKDGLLSIEHIIPSCIGGKLVTLTCKTCNNLHGTALDAKLVAHFRFRDQITGKNPKPLRATVKIGEGEFTADILFKGKEIDVLGLPNLSNPKQLQYATNALEVGVDTITFQRKLVFGGPEVTAAIIRVAYLLMFRFFGYGYVFHPNLEPVRNRIMNPHVETWQTAILTAHSLPSNNAVALLKKPTNLRCFMAMLDLSTETIRHLIVILPGLDKQSEHDVCSLWAGMAHEELVSLDPRADVFFHASTNLTDPQNLGLALRIWRGMVEVVDKPT